MVKAYLRYVHEESFGLLTSPHSNLSFFSPPGSSHSRTSKSYVLTCSGPAVILWSPAQQVELAKFSPISASSVASSTPHHAVRLALSVFHTHLAVGYSDGSIRVWQMPKAEETVTLAASSALLGRHTERTPGAKGLANLQNPTPHSTLYGHRSAITALRWVGLGQGWTPEEGQRKGQTELETARNVCTADSTFLVSGSAEGDIIVWDRLAGAGLHRIHAHSAPVTDLVVINKRQRGALLPAGRRSEGGGGKRKEVDRDSRKNEKTRNRGEPESSGRGAKLSGAHEGGHSEDDNIGERHGNDFRGHALNRGGGSAETGGQSGMLAISCGKDGSVKIWDVDLELCLQTVVDGIAGTPGGREVWSLAISPNQTRLVVGCADHLLRVYALNQFGGSSFIGTSSLTADETGEGQREVPVDPHTGLARVAVFLGNIPRESSGKRRTTSMQFLSIGSGSPREEQSLLLSEEDEDEGILVVGSGQSRSVEIFKFCGEAERRKRMKRRKKRLQEKQKKRQTGTATEEEEQHERDEDEGEGFKVTDEFVFLSRLYSEGIIKAFHLRAVSASHRRGGEELRKRKRAAQCQQQIEVALGLADNAFEIWDIDIGSLSDRFSQTAIKQEGVVAKTAEANGGLTRVWRVDGGGHRGTIRQLSVSHDSAYLLSVADEGLKVWTAHSRRCVRTVCMDDSPPLCAFFVAGNDHLVVGTKAGDLLLYDLAACAVKQKLPQAHGSAVNALAEHPKHTGFASVSADKSVKLFVFYLSGGVSKESDSVLSSGQRKDKKEKSASPFISSSSERTVQFRQVGGVPLPDQGLDVKYSPDGRLLVCALLDMTIVVLYADSCKLFLSLYGHQLPILSIAVSSDSTLLASGSADKTVKLWGLDFGNIQQSLLAHEESVTQVLFLFNTHYVLSASTDASVKLWDADRRSCLVCVLPALSNSPVRALACTPDGDLLFSADTSRLFLCWRRTEEQMFAEEEQEKRWEEAAEREALREDVVQANQLAVSSDIVMSRASKRTLESIRTTERLMEVLDEAREQQGLDEAYAASLAAWENAERELLRKQNPTPPNERAKPKKSKSPASSALDLLRAATARGGGEGGVTMQSEAELPPKPKRPPGKVELMGRTAMEHVMRALAALRPGDTFEVLIALPFEYAYRLLEFLVAYLSVFYAVSLRENTEVNAQRQRPNQEVSFRPVGDEQRKKAELRVCQSLRYDTKLASTDATENCGETTGQNGLQEAFQFPGVWSLCPVESAARVALHLVQLNFRLFLVSPAHRQILVCLQRCLRPLLTRERDRMRFNTAALSFMQRQIEQERVVP